MSNSPAPETNLAPPERLTQTDLDRELVEGDFPPPRQRRIVLPVVLLLATCVSAWFAGATRWNVTTAWEQCKSYESGMSSRVEHSGYLPLLKRHDELLREALPTPDTTCLVCGPPQFNDDARWLLMKLGVSDSRILTEKY